MEKFPTPQNNSRENSPDAKDTLVGEIKILEKEIDLMKSENQELFDDYEKTKERVSFVMELASYKCIEDNNTLISQNKKLLVDYLVNGTVANSPHLKEEHNNPETITNINAQFKSGLDDVQGTDEPFSQENFQKIFQKVSVIQDALNNLEEALSKKTKELLQVEFLEQKESALEKYQGYFTKYTALHTKLKKEQEKLEHTINSLIQPNLDLGMTREIAIKVYREQPDSEVLKTSELYELTEMVTKLEDLILELEIHIENINDSKYTNYNSYKELTDAQLSRKLNKESFIREVSRMDDIY